MNSVRPNIRQNLSKQPKSAAVNFYSSNTCLLFGTGLEIPDSDAERLFKPSDLIKYIATRENLDGNSGKFESNYFQQPK